MEEKKELTKELKELNKHLKSLKRSGRHMIYSANPFKFAFFNFLAGIFHSLGSLVGYVIIFGIIAYLISQVNLGNLMGQWVEDSLQQVDWNKVVPMPENNFQQQLPQNLNQEDLEQLQRQLSQ